MYFQVQHRGKMIFFREGPDVVVLMREARDAGINIKPDNIDDEKSRVYGTNFPKEKRDGSPRDWTEAAIAKAYILLLDLHIKEHP